MPSVQTPTHLPELNQRRQDLLALLLILLVAGLFRLWLIDAYPPGLFGDEAVNGLDALDVLAGRPQVFFPANFGREGLHMLVLAPFISWLGATATALRLPSVIAGILTCLATYWLGRELLSRTRLRGTVVPLLAALYLSTSYWHVHFSRFGIRGVFTPLFIALTFAAFWRGANRMVEGGPPHDWRGWPSTWFLLAGVFLGLGVHFYTASRLVPIFLGTFLVVQWILVSIWSRAQEAAAAQPRRAPDYPPLLKRAFWPIVAMFAVSALVFAPLGLYFLRTPGSLAQRADAVSILNPTVSGGDPLGLLWRAAAANVLQFFLPGAGDQAAFYNLPGRAVFDPLTALLAVAGLLICLWAAVRGSSPHLFILLWCGVMLVPTFLAVDRFPTLPRALGVLPGIYFLPALALGELFTRLAKARKGVAAALAIVVIAWHGALTWHDYFNRWASAAETFDAFEGDIAAAAGWLAGQPETEVFLSADIYRHPSFVFLHEKVPLTEILSYRSPQVHFFDGRSSLPLPPPGRAATYLFTHNAGPNPVLDGLAGWPGFTALETVSGPGEPALTVATLAAGATDGQPALTDAGIPFSPSLRLEGYQVQPDADGQTTVILLWQVGDPLPDQPFGLQIQAGLLPGDAGQQLTQASAEFTYRPTEWMPGGRALTWLALDWPADELDRDAHLALRLVDHASGVPLRPAAADDDGWLVLPLSVE